MVLLSILNGVSARERMYKASKWKSVSLFKCKKKEANEAKGICDSKKRSIVDDAEFSAPTAESRGAPGVTVSFFDTKLVTIHADRPMIGSIDFLVLPNSCPWTILTYLVQHWRWVVTYGGAVNRQWQFCIDRAPSSEQCFVCP